MKLGKGLAQRLHLLDALRNVARHDDDFGRAPVRILDHAPLRFDVPDGAVGPQHAILRPLANPPRDGLLKNSFDSLLVVRMNFLK